MISASPAQAWLARHLPTRQMALRLGLALAIGAIGGTLFFIGQLPLPWMLGAMSTATVAALAGAKLAVPPTLRSAMIAILGVLLGSQFTPSLFENLSQWYVGLAAVVISTALMALACIVFFRVFARYDRTTAYFAAMPGGLSEMMLLGESMGGDARTISLTHGVRILLAVFLIAFYFRLFEGFDGSQMPVTTAASLPLWEIVALLACAFVGLYAGKRLRLPAPQIVGPMILSAGLHLSGVLEHRPPAEIVALAQVILGAAIGARFSGMALRNVWRVMFYAAGATVIMLMIAVGIAYGLAPVAGTSGSTLLLALAPGGLAEMSLIALALGNVAAFVSTHHVVRIIVVVIIAPQLFRLLYGKPKPDATQSPL
ncbi:MAG: AbrB family transcriptional regulator [Alphaproteobacteria bacterium]|nr:AbrB family transcriptional regulator [Alphaproteobacteria bacterium]